MLSSFSLMTKVLHLCCSKSKSSEGKRKHACSLEHPKVTSCSEQITAKQTGSAWGQGSFCTSGSVNVGKSFYLRPPPPQNGTITTI